MKLQIFKSLIPAALLLMTGCGGGGSSSSSGPTGDTGDIVISTIIDNNTGFMSLIDGSKSSMTNDNGLEVTASKGVYTYKGNVYVTGALTDNKIAKYSVNSDNSLKLVKEFSINDSGNSIPTTFIFVNENKAYLPLAGSGELLDINLQDFTVRDRIDLSDYAMDGNTTLHSAGGTDTNPEPSAGVIRDGKLFLALGQVNFLGHTEGAFLCRGKASVLVIDIATNTIEKHLTDNRTCTSGSISPGAELTLTDDGDIYVNNTASFGYDARGFRPGYLRIKAGEEQFDPDYFFNIGDLDLSADFPDMNASLARTPYAYKEKYHNGTLYVTTLVLGLTTLDPNDFIGNKNYQPYALDLENQTATKIDMLPTNGWSAHITTYKGDLVFAGSTVDGNGIYKLGEKTPFIATEGFPYLFYSYDKQ